MRDTLDPDRAGRCAAPPETPASVVDPIEEVVRRATEDVIASRFRAAKLERQARSEAALISYFDRPPYVCWFCIGRGERCSFHQGGR